MIIDDIRNGQNGNQQAVMDLVNKFLPALKKYARKLETEDAHFDLQAEFLDLILHLNCDKMRETGDGAMVQYLSRSIYHAYIKLLRQLIDNKMPCISTNVIKLKHKFQKLVCKKVCALYCFSVITERYGTPQFGRYP